MPLTVDNSPELLSEVVDMAQQKEQRVRVTRPFYHRGEPLGVDTVLDLNRSVAAELHGAGKVEIVASDTKLAKNTEVDPPKPASQPSNTVKDADKKGKAA